MHCELSTSSGVLYVDVGFGGMIASKLYIIVFLVILKSMVIVLTC